MQIQVWCDEFLGYDVAIDTETNIADFKSRDHRIITFQAYAGGDVCYFVERKDIRKFLTKHLDSRLIMHHAPFDMGVIGHEVPIGLVHHFYDNNQVYDTKTIFQLLHLAVAGYIPHQAETSLANLSKRVLNRDMSKDMKVRGTFDQFKHTPIMQIPKEWLRYAAQDAVNTYDIYLTLMGEIKKVDTKETLLTLHIQAKGDYATDQMVKNGVGVNLDRVAEVKASLKDEIKNYEKRLAVWGWVRGRPKIRDIEKQIFEHIGILDTLPRTDAGHISRSYDDLIAYKDKPFVMDYLEYLRIEKMLTFLDPLTEKVLHPTYNYLLNTGRLGCSKPNFQNLPRSGDIRSCFVPKSKDNVFAIIDYSGIELCTLAQINYSKFGHSTMRDLLNDSEDLHTYFAKKAFGKDSVTKEERQLGKIFNFGNGSNMGPETFVDYARGSGVTLTIDECITLKRIWLDTFPEMQDFFAEGARASKDYNDRTETLTGRLRANCNYTTFLNTQFQGLASDGLKLAMYEIIKHGYHLVGAVHDEIIVEVPKGKDIKPIEDIMIREMRKIVPDVRIAVESQLSNVYCK